MMSEPIVYLVTDSVVKQDEVACQGVVASPVRALGIPLDRWQGTISCPKKPMVYCRVKTVNSVGVGYDESGERIAYHDQEVFIPPSIEDSLRNAAANSMCITIEESSFPWQCPVFISSDPAVETSLERVIVRIEVGNLGELPDIQAYIAYLEMMDRVFEGIGLGDGSHTDSVKDTAQAIAVGVGQLLPVTITSLLDRPAHCVIRLDNEVNQSVFEATLVCDKFIPPILPGSHLFRSVEWEEEGHMCRRSSRVATILSAAPGLAVSRKQ